MENKYFSQLIMLVVAAMFSVNSFAADKLTVKGTITGPNRQALSDVVVTDTSTNVQATTNKKGVYKIETSPDATLSYSMLGLEFATEPVDGRTSIDMVYGEENETSVSVGYGTQDRDNITNAVASVGPESFSDAPSAGLAETLRGKSAGLNINSGNEAGTSSTVSLRGMISISSSSGVAPLVIVDGFPMPDGLDAINSADVASVEVLKDAASASIYGARAAGGVILVTTKMGKAESEARAKALAEARAKAKAEKAEAKAAKAEAKAAAKAAKEAAAQ